MTGMNPTARQRISAEVGGEIARDFAANLRGRLRTFLNRVWKRYQINQLSSTMTLMTDEQLSSIGVDRSEIPARAMQIVDAGEQAA